MDDLSVAEREHRFEAVAVAVPCRDGVPLGGVLEDHYAFRGIMVGAQVGAALEVSLVPYRR